MKRLFFGTFKLSIGCEKMGQKARELTRKHASKSMKATLSAIEWPRSVPVWRNSDHLGGKRVVWEWHLCACKQPFKDPLNSRCSLSQSSVSLSFFPSMFSRELQLLQERKSDLPNKLERNIDTLSPKQWIGMLSLVYFKTKVSILDHFISWI